MHIQKLLAEIILHLLHLICRLYCIAVDVAFGTLAVIKSPRCFAAPACDVIKGLDAAAGLFIWREWQAGSRAPLRTRFRLCPPWTRVYTRLNPMSITQPFCATFSTCITYSLRLSLSNGIKCLFIFILTNSVWNTSRQRPVHFKVEDIHL